MSSFYGRAVHPKTGETEDAVFIDNHFGPHNYGVKFRDGSTWPDSQVREAVETMEGQLSTVAPTVAPTIVGPR